MKVLVNAIACRVAGGRTVGLNFLRCYRESGFPHDLIVYAPAGVGYEELDGGRVRVEVAPPVVHQGLARPWVDHVWSRRILARHRPDVLFAMGSIAYPTRIPQVVLYHWPYAIYPEPEVWQHMSLADVVTRRVRRWLFGGRRHHAAWFAAQTETAKQRLERLWGLDNVEVIPNAVSLPPRGDRAPQTSAYADRIPDGKRALLCLTRWYPHKNLEILLELGRRIRDEKLPWVVLTTVSPGDDRAAARWVAAVDRGELGEVIVNLGSVPMEEVPGLYAASSGLLLPTLLESFTGTYVEAMHFGRPVFTSDRDFAHDVCGDVAWYFDPHDGESIRSTLARAFDDPAEMQRRVDRGLRRTAEFPEWPEVTERYVRLLERAGGQR